MGKTDTNNLPASPLEFRDLLGTPRLLPDESREDYEAELTALLSDLRTESPLAVVLTEQMLEAIRWARRHSADKVGIILSRMADVIGTRGYSTDEVLVAREALVTTLSDPANTQARAILDEHLERTGHSLDSARAAAMLSTMDKISKIDDLIARQLRTAQQLQKSIAAIEVKPHLLRRLELQVHDLERDLAALEPGDK